MPDWLGFIKRFKKKPARDGRTAPDSQPSIGIPSPVSDEPTQSGEPVEGQPTDEFFVVLEDSQKALFRDEEMSGYVLDIEAGVMEGTRIPLVGTHVTLGRSAICDVCLDDPMISDQHLEIILERGRPAALEDLGSTNGTRVNDKQVKQAPLKPNDLIQVGHTKLVFQKEES